MQKLRNTEAELKKSVVYKKKNVHCKFKKKRFQALIYFKETKLESTCNFLFYYYFFI